MLFYVVSWIFFGFMGIVRILKEVLCGEFVTAFNEKAGRGPSVDTLAAFPNG